MIRVTRPQPSTLARFVGARSAAPPFSDSPHLPEPLPPCFARNHSRASLGRGKATYLTARQALAHWLQFPGDWIEAAHDGAAAHPGQIVAVAARCLGLWTVNACRVVHVDESTDGEATRFDIVYATLPDHKLEGAERFRVEWDHSTDQVWYDLASYSRPVHWLAKVCHPLIRRLQRRFAHDSFASLQHIVNRATGLSSSGSPSKR